MGGFVAALSYPTARDTALGRGLRSSSDKSSPGEPRFYVTDISGNALLDVGNTSQPMILAGITKLYTLAMLLREFDRGALSPDTRASHLLPAGTLTGLCVVGGKDYSDEITIAQLLSHRSGITDYFAHPKTGALSLVRQIEDRDRRWTFEQALELARHYPGRFRPGSPGRVHYSDTNYQILGAILRATTGLLFTQLLSIRITGPLALKKTYAFTHETAEKYYELAPITWKKQEVHIPESLASCGPDGAIISTARELTTFLSAFWSGKLFDESWVTRTWADPVRVAGPWGMGLGVFTFRRPATPVPFVGHSGFTGSVALVDPTRRFFGGGSFNQVQKLNGAIPSFAKMMKKLEA